MYNVALIDSPALYLEVLIEDTFSNKIKWESLEMDHGWKNSAVIPIVGTKKYIQLEFYSMGGASFIKTAFHRGPDWLDIVDFESINANKERERLVRLQQAISRQQSGLTATNKYHRNKLIEEIKKRLKES